MNWCQRTASVIFCWCLKIYWEINFFLIKVASIYLGLISEENAYFSTHVYRHVYCKVPYDRFSIRQTFIEIDGGTGTGEVLRYYTELVQVSTKMASHKSTLVIYLVILFNANSDTVPSPEILYCITKGLSQT